MASPQKCAAQARLRLVVVLVLLLCWAGGAAAIDDLQVPVNVKVVLIGFENGDGAYEFNMASQPLHDLLTRSLKVRAPLMRSESGDHERLGVQYQVNYEVSHLRRQAYQPDLFNVMRGAMETVTGGAEEGADEAVFMLPSVTAYYSALFKTLSDPVKAKYYVEGHDGEGEHFLKSEYFVFVVNLDPAALEGRPTSALSRTASVRQILEGVNYMPYSYAFNRAANNGTSVFVGPEGYVVIDVNAKPSEVTRVAAPVGTKPIVGVYAGDRVPNLAGFLRRTAALDQELGRLLDDKETTSMFAIDITAAVHSAIQQFFLPDLQLETHLHIAKVVVPIIVLRNHDLFNPLDSDTFNLNVIETMVRHIVPKDQEVQFYQRVHFLHDHPQIALALQKSLDSVAVQRYNETYSVMSLNSKAFATHLGETTDVLLASLIDLDASGEQQQQQQQQQKKFADAYFRSSSSNRHRQEYNDKATVQFIESQAKKTSDTGVRIVPIVVFSLLEPYGDLLVDLRSNYASVNDLIVVVQTGKDAVPTMFGAFDPASPPLTINARGTVDRAIAAGLFESLAGVVSPLERLDSPEAAIQEDLMWAIGYHPFSLWSHSSPASFGLALASTITTAQRNIVLSRVHGIRAILTDIQNELTLFLRTYGFSALSPNFRASMASVEQGDFIPNAAVKKTIIETALKLESELLMGVTLYKSLSSSIKRRQLSDAYSEAGALLDSTLSLRHYVKSSLAHVAHDLSCCFSSNTTVVPRKS